MTRLSLIFAFAMLAVSGPVRAEEKSLYVDYQVNQHIQTANDDREIITSIYLAGANGFGYRRQEWIRGAIDPVVTSTAFSNEGLIMSEKDQEAFGQALQDAGVFNLTSPPPDNDHRDYSYRLYVRIHNREGDFDGYSAPTKGVAQAVDTVIRDFAHRMNADKPLEAAKVSEGDHQKITVT